MESLLVITNTEAGSVDEHSIRRAVDVLRTEADVQVCRTSVPGDLDGVLHRRGGRTVVVAGGDGSLHTVVTALHRRMELDDTVVGLLPLGTANDFARGVGLPLDPADAARVVLSGVERRRDLLIDCRGDVVVHRVRLVPGEQSDRRRATLRLRVETESAGQSTVICDFDRPVAWVQLRNADRPESDPEDVGSPSAEVRLAVVDSPLRRLAGTVGRRLGRAGKPSYRVLAERVHIAGQRFYLDADGETSGPEQRRTWTVSPGRLRLISPA